MKVGRLTEAVEDRAVVRILERKGAEQVQVVTRQLDGGQLLAAATGAVCLEYGCQAGFLADQVLGLLCIKGVQRPVLAVSAAIPVSWGEVELKALARNIRQIMEQRGVEDYTVHARVQSGINMPVLTMTGSGVSESARRKADIQEAEKAEEAEELEKAEEAALEGMGLPGAFPKLSIVMAGYAALEATACIICARREQLQKYLSGHYLDEGMRLALETDIRPAVCLAREHGARVRAAGEGGIFAALWELGRSLDCGMVIQIQEILMRQETIEVCEIADANPYQVLSTGSILAVTGRPQGLLGAYQKAGIPAAEIGILTKEHDRVLPNGEDTRYLEPFRGDEIYRTGILHG